MQLAVARVAVEQRRVEIEPGRPRDVAVLEQEAARELHRVRRVHGHVLARGAAGFVARTRVGERARDVCEHPPAQVAALLLRRDLLRLFGRALAQHVEVGVARVG